MNKKYEEWLSENADSWLSDPNKYEDVVANFTMSPKDLEHYWQNKNEYIENITPIGIGDGENKISPTIKNSTGNRNPNWTDKEKRRKKITYFFGIVSYARDYNMLPISLIINEDGELQYEHLLAKDRGTINYYMSRRDDKLALTFWKSVKKHMEVEYPELLVNKPKFKAIYDNLEKLINAKKSLFSMREVVPTTMYNDWNNDEQMINIRMKFERYISHTGEMVRLNNTTNLWVNHNKIKAKIIIPMVVKYPNRYPESFLDDIYNSCKDEPLFVGEEKKILNPPNRTVEESEEILPWIFTGLKNEDDLDVVSILARDTASNLKKLEKSYRRAFELGVDEFREAISLMTIVAENPSLKQYNKAHSDFIDTKYTNKEDKPANLTELKTVGWVNFIMICHAVYNICLDTLDGRVSNERINKVTTKFFQNAITLFGDKKLLNDLALKKGSTEKRYQEFFKVAKDKTIEEITKESLKGYNMTQLYKVMSEHLEEYGYSTKKCIVYDRVSSTQFREIEVDFYNENLPEGHLIPTEPKKYGNVITQLPEDNVYNNHKPISDLGLYVSEYQNQLDSWIKDNNLEKDARAQSIKHRTHMFLEGLKEQEGVTND